MGPNQFSPLFDPRSVAVFGASDKSDSVGAKVFSNIIGGGYEGTLIAINPKHKAVHGKPCFPSIAAADMAIDLAVIATPGRTVAAILKECGEAGIRNAIILSAGFGETGEKGLAGEEQLRAIARKYSIRFIGPNCVGIVRPWSKLNATFLKSPPPAGRLALVSQSGALCSAISDWAEPQHLGFSALVSLGNSVDVDFGDVLNFLATDPKTEAILLYVEGVRHAPSFISALRVAAGLKPVIVLKAGRHNQSSKAAHTHTGALIGSDAVFDAALERSGAVRAHTYGQLFAAAEILSAGKRAAGNNLGIITNGGGAGVLAADRAGDLHVNIPAPSPETVEALDNVLPPFWSHANPVDILGDAGPQAYGAAVAACLKDKAFDGVLVMLTPQAMTNPMDAAQAVIDAIPKGNRKPVLVCWMGETSVREARALLSSKGIPDFLTPERAIEGFYYLARHELNRRMALELPGPLSDLEAPDVDGARMIIAQVLAEGRSMLSDLESKAVLSAFRIPVNTTLEASSPAKALIAAETVGFPVAVKINSPQITHKSDVGGVRMNIMSATTLQSAFREIVEDARKARPEADIHGVTVEAMVKLDHARELIAGASRDPVFGPTIVFGAGGKMVEVLDDSAVSLPPLNAVLAQRLIRRTRVSRLLDAFRDSPPADSEAVIGVLVRISDMVCELPEIEELDINPLFASPEGVMAVDARIRVSRPPATQGRYEHVAIAPYPRHLIQREVMSDGMELVIRPIRPEDAESERDFVHNLSEQARKFRFMHAMNDLSPSMLARFTHIDYSREMAFVAIAGSGDERKQVGVARYSANPDGKSCEFAVVVADSMQGRGVGTKLMRALMSEARDRGLTIMEGTVLTENAGMLQLMQSLGFSMRRSPEEPELYLVERWL
ncbi:MAG: bifunctional acetate--CoA ligase family protein/GNAT family N-acetyltransferase [Notoacmeibacter sp.]|nr:bifunctional acetate--CoA ligase family protein/GNAT family N-acetyltransferase [Notoacmeibacter sp.]